VTCICVARPRTLSMKRHGCLEVQRFRGGLIFKAHRLLYHSTLGWRVIKKKKGAISDLHLRRQTAHVVHERVDALLRSRVVLIRHHCLGNGVGCVHQGFGVQGWAGGPRVSPL